MRVVASVPGGRADKLGNEFERLWAVRHLIELVAGKASAVSIESLGDDEKGTEFWVTRPNGTREAHQCKRENASAGRWSVAALEAKRIISNAKFHLDRDPMCRFIFVSGDKAPHLADLCERAGMCESASEFRAHSVTTSRQLLDEFRALCSYLKVDADEPGGIGQALDFLRRFRPLSEDKLTLRGQVEDFAAAWLTGDPALAVAALKDLVDKSIGLTIRADDVVRALPDGIRPHDLSREPTLLSRLDALCERFDRSYRHLLIGGVILGRRETEDVWRSIMTEPETRVVLLHGPGGEGKSGVVFELVERLRERGVAYLPLRLDRDRPGDTPLEFGRQLGLPGSPAACLAAGAAGGRGVLILDQVDAIRWTSAHSSHAWDTCERVIAEALRHPNLVVVVVCRSFDVEDDPRLRAWKTQSKAKEVKVGPLDDEILNRVLAALGATPAALGPAQRRVLRSPQALYLWTLLHESTGPAFAFRGIADLTREFWAVTRRKLRELKPGSYEEVLETLVEYLDKRGAFAAPRTCVSRWAPEVDALVSMNVLAADQGKVIFAHQSYLDHLTAERVLREVHAGSDTVVGWLQRNDQSLFRRGQLRQLLTLLRDDDAAGYEESVRALLTSDAVRFHLKHLALLLLGQADPPTTGEIDLAVALLGDEKWLDHVTDLVFTGREAWIDALHARGVLAGWLAGDEGLARRALYLLSRVTESRGELVEALLLDERRDARREEFERVLWMSAPERLSPRLFKTCVRMTRRGSRSRLHSIRWGALAASNGSRCLEVFEAVLLGEARRARAAMVDESTSRQETRSVRREDADQVAAAAAAIPIEAWDRLVPLLLRILRRVAASRRIRSVAGFSSSRYLFERELWRIIVVLARVLRGAGSAMAATDGAAFWERVNRLSGIRSPAVQRLLARCMAAGRDEQADVSLRWLVADRARLRCGGRRGGFYAPAYKLLRRYSRLCSDDVLSDVVAAILAHRPGPEKREFLHRHGLLIESLKAPAGRGGADVLTYHAVGLGQYLLLAALPQRRLTGEATRRLGVLRRRFGPVGPLLPGSPRIGGGWVRSTIPEDRLPRLSDRHWLAVIKGRWRERPRRWRQMGPDRVGEATVETFARDLGSMTRLEPRRFARLALAIPASTDPHYARALLQNLVDTEPPSNDRRPEEWQAATVGEIEAVANHFEQLKDDEEFATALCRAIMRRSTEPWSAGTYEWLARIAMTHPHPREGEYSVYSGGKLDQPAEPDILGTSINCVRGAAAETILAILFTRREARETFARAIEALTHDPHPSVRVATVGLALPLFNIDRAAAVTTFLAACAHESDEVLRAHYVNEFLRYTILKYADDVGPLIERMVRSRVDDVARAGAGWVSVVWAHSGMWGERFARCRSGSAQIRQGIARALAIAVADECSNPDAKEKLWMLFDDPDKDVRASAASFFRSEDAFETAAARSLALRFVASAALDDNMGDLLMGLEHYAGKLKDYAEPVLAVADRLAGRLAPEARDYQTQRPLDADMLAKVLLRLYEQAEHEQELRGRCLDAWDNLMSQRIGVNAFREIDA
jgi:hypothetical protein